VFPELEGQGYYEWLDQVYQTGKHFSAYRVPIKLTAANHKPSEKILDFIYEPVIDGAGQVTGIFVEGYDVTEVYLAQEAQRASEKQFHALTQCMPSQAWMALPSGKLEWFNERVYKYSGYTEHQLLGDGWSSIVHPDDLPMLLSRWNHALVTGEPYEGEFRLRRSDGQYRWHLARAVPIRCDQNRIERWIGTTTDVHIAG
jgi:PAS domain S-box-containing protein